MDDIQLLLYIIFIIIAILSRAFKGKKKQPAPKEQPQRENQPGGRTEKTLTFEELLREFTGDDTAQKPKEEPRRETKYETLETTESYETEFEREYPSDDEIQQVYEESVREAKKLKTLNEMVDLEDDRHTGNFQHFRGYEEAPDEVPNEFAEMFQDTEGAKKAVILSEILNRKY